MEPLPAILVFGSLMTAVALVGGAGLLLGEQLLQRCVKPLVALSSGSLIGSALFHMLPAAIERTGNSIATYVAIAAGMLLFLMLEQFLHWHHCHRPAASHRRPLGLMILAADTLHNLIGGIAIGALFVADFRLGFVAWLAAVAHEIPQELGDFGVLVHSGFSRRQALVLNFATSLSFPFGALAAYWLSGGVDLGLLIPFAAGNFLYIGAVDLMPELKEGCEGRPQFANTAWWIAGLAATLAAAAVG